MRADDLDRIEAALGIRLPPDYRALMLDYPFRPDPDSTSLWLLDDPEAVVEETLRMRAAPPSGAPRPLDLVHIGGDGGEELYFLDVSREPAPVLAWDLETGELARRAADLPTWVDELRRELRSIEADEEAMAARARGRRWWQFWIRP